MADQLSILSSCRRAVPDRRFFRISDIIKPAALTTDKPPGKSIHCFLSFTIIKSGIVCSDLLHLVEKFSVYNGRMMVSDGIPWNFSKIFPHPMCQIIGCIGFLRQHISCLTFIFQNSRNPSCCPALLQTTFQLSFPGILPALSKSITFRCWYLADIQPSG